ncbi:MAG: D-alanyl-D-alanine carboxypeptidase family protein [Jatrophihabitans sp.]|uniref:D-alanyl-D-alanine carboxypeptidase family protein n=1 Tax=Jatrophihabitans sp. TaxID=1932789 RepID=UPI003F80F952
MITLTAPDDTPSVLRRRRGPILLTLLLVVAVLAGTGAVLLHQAWDDAGRHYLSTDGWPQRGQGAYRIGDETPHASAGERPVPIASLAKMMTALLVVDAWPLDPTADGRTITITAADVADTAARHLRDESVVPVAAGERLTERQALMALLLPSANNIAIVLADRVAGSVPAFVDRMNRRAHELGMPDTTYTDPSGFDAHTVSTARDQLLVAEAFADDPTLRAMVRVADYRLPVAGVVHNTDHLVGTAGFAGLKTGSDDAAGGCFAFLVYRSIGGVNVSVIGVVLGQQGHRLVDAALYAAKQLVDRLAPDPVHP